MRFALFTLLACAQPRLETPESHLVRSAARDAARATRVVAPEPMVPAYVDLDLAKDGDESRGSIHAIASDVWQCGQRRDERGHARISFDRYGRVTDVLVDAPADQTKLWTTCVVARFRTARATPFRGDRVVVGVSFALEPAEDKRWFDRSEFELIAPRE